MPKATLHLIVDGRTPIDAVAAALAAGVDVIQLRDRSSAARDLYQQAQSLLPEIRSAKAGLIVNDRLDVGLAVAATGVHLAGRSLAPQVARTVAGELLLGASVHSLPDALAIAPWVDYLTFGPIFATASHPGQLGAGLVALAEVVRSVPCPVLAIGGIGPANAASVVTAGASGVVVISAILQAENVARATADLRQSLDLGPDPMRADPALIKGGRLRW